MSVTGFKVILFFEAFRQILAIIIVVRVVNHSRLHHHVRVYI
jgi:hypothetical protein